MRKLILVGVLALSFSVGMLAALEGPQPAAPVKEHEWLKQLVGEWETKAEAIVEPGKPPMKCQGTETVRSLGGLWTISESKSEVEGVQVSGVLTLGYDPKKGKYVGTWIDSMSNNLWTYEGKLDESGKKLMLETEGPLPDGSGKVGKFKETLEIKDKDHRVFSSSVQVDGGDWTTFMTMEKRRKK